MPAEVLEPAPDREIVAVARAVLLAPAPVKVAHAVGGAVSDSVTLIVTVGDAERVRTALPVAAVVADTVDEAAADALRMVADGEPVASRDTDEHALPVLVTVAVVETLEVALPRADSVPLGEMDDEKGCVAAVADADVDGVKLTVTCVRDATADAGADVVAVCESVRVSVGDAEGLVEIEIVAVPFADDETETVCVTCDTVGDADALPDAVTAAVVLTDVVTVAG